MCIRDRFILDCRRRLSSHGQTLSEQINKIGKEVADSHDRTNPTSAVFIQEEHEDISGSDGGNNSLLSSGGRGCATPVSYTHLRAHETPEHLVCRLLLEKKKFIQI
eukprot:TRINITY_DN57353_c0_g1_i1.p1 TRINITY_DN57353_c0_g1~~TRINITY_DN57353_c0_g1_i1.p1  ORF type:complete len:106 (+),score=17.93 TRINITY_DN57353_c0_g1_i1:99-416(+)